MKTIALHSTKYDRSLHYRYAAQLVHEEPGHIMLYVMPGTRIESYRGAMLATNHSLQLYWVDRSYNVHINWYSDWRPRTHYVNIASPASWPDGTLHFIDLDLDVIWRAQSGEVILDDEDEFALHQVRFAYPTDLIAECLRSSVEVRDMIARRDFPFDGSLYAWRPDGAPQ